MPCPSFLVTSDVTWPAQWSWEEARERGEGGCPILLTIFERVVNGLDFLMDREDKVGRRS